MSSAPDLVEDEKEHHGHAAPDKDDLFLPIVPDYRNIIVNVQIPIEKLMSPAPHKNPDKGKEDHGESESNAQRRNCFLFNHRCHQQISDVHSRTVSTRVIGCDDASVGFSCAAEGGITFISSEGEQNRGQRPRL